MNTVESRFSNLLGEKYIETLYVIFDHSGFIRDLWSSLTESRVTKWPQDLLVFQLRDSREEMETWCKKFFSTIEMHSYRVSKQILYTKKKLENIFWWIFSEF